MTDSRAKRRHEDIARMTGLCLLAVIIIGIGSALTLASGIDINLSADFASTPAAMMEADSALRALAYLSIVGFALNSMVTIGLYRLTEKSGDLMPVWALIAGITAAILTLLGGVSTMTAALLSANEGFAALGDESQRLLLVSLQAATNYTAFHLGLILSSLSMAVYFWLFFQSRQIPSLLSGFGMTASLFVAIAIGLRDFIAFLASDAVTALFMVSNLLALVGLGIYLTVWRVRPMDG
ncbi:MAG: DUF4386 domain-containing protein [Pseudomonadota bacterium]